MKWLERIVKKRKNPQAVYMLIYYANKKHFIDSLTDEQRQWLINRIKESHIEECTCCPCFAWDFNEKQKIIGCSCTLGGVASEYGKGQCGFERNSIE